MKALKAIGQVLAAILYTNLYTGLLYLIIVMPVTWILTLRPLIIVILVIFLGGIIQSIIIGAQTLIFVPYVWIVKRNVIALLVSIGFMLFNLVRSAVRLWQCNLGQGTWITILLVVFSLMILEALIISVVGVYKAYSDDIIEK